MPISATFTISSSVSFWLARTASGTGCQEMSASPLPPPEAVRASCVSWTAMCFSRMRRLSLSTMYMSGLVSPETRASPRPAIASTVILERSLVTGSTVNITPERSDCTIFWTGTAIFTFICSKPFSTR